MFCLFYITAPPGYLVLDLVTAVTVVTVKEFPVHHRATKRDKYTSKPQNFNKCQRSYERTFGVKQFFDKFMLAIFTTHGGSSFNFISILVSLRGPVDWIIGSHSMAPSVASVWRSEEPLSLIVLNKNNMQYASWSKCWRQLYKTALQDDDTFLKLRWDT